MYSQEEGGPTGGRINVDRSSSDEAVAVVETPSQVMERFEGEASDEEPSAETKCTNV